MTIISLGPEVALLSKVLEGKPVKEEPFSEIGPDCALRALSSSSLVLHIELELRCLLGVVIPVGVILFLQGFNLTVGVPV